MFREKLIATLVIAAAIVGVTMLADFGITILMLGDWPGYTPFVTFAISTLVAIPVTYAFVSGRANLRQTRDALSAALAAAQEARLDAQTSLREVEEARAKAETDRVAAIEASRAKSEFLANMSHELRTPLKRNPRLLGGAVIRNLRRQARGILEVDPRLRYTPARPRQRPARSLAHRGQQNRTARRGDQCPSSARRMHFDRGTGRCAEEPGDSGSNLDRVAQCRWRPPGTPADFAQSPFQRDKVQQRRVAHRRVCDQRVRWRHVHGCQG